MNHLTKPEQPDRSKINLTSVVEVKSWAHALGVSTGELRLLVEKIGNSAALVRKEIELLRRKKTATDHGDPVRASGVCRQK